MSIKPGALRFNTDSMKMEIFRGSANYEGSASMAGIGTLAAGQWEEIVATSDFDRSLGGRGVFGGGAPFTNIMDYITIPSTGNAIDFGDLTQSKSGCGSVSSSTRGVFGYGETPGGPPGGTDVNVMEYITIASTGNAIDFGDLPREGHSPGPVGNSVRGIFCGGGTPSNFANMDFITMSTLGNSAEFGDLITAKRRSSAGNNAIRGVIFGGSGDTTTIEYVTISTLGDAIDFGDMFTGGYSGTSGNVSSRTRAYTAGGYFAPAYNNHIQYIQIMSTGNAIDSGDLTGPQGNCGGVSNGTRGVRGGGSPSVTNIIDFWELQSGGNATDFGDLTRSNGEVSGVSDSHGGV